MSIPGTLRIQQIIPKIQKMKSLILLVNLITGSWVRLLLSERGGVVVLMGETFECVAVAAIRGVIGVIYPPP